MHKRALSVHVGGTERKRGGCRKDHPVAPSSSRSAGPTGSGDVRWHVEKERNPNVSPEGSPKNGAAPAKKPAKRVSPRKVGTVSAAAIGLLSMGAATIGLASTAWGSQVPNAAPSSATATTATTVADASPMVSKVAWN